MIINAVPDGQTARRYLPNSNYRATSYLVVRQASLPSPLEPLSFARTHTRVLQVVPVLSVLRGYWRPGRPIKLIRYMQYPPPPAIASTAVSYSHYPSNPQWLFASPHYINSKHEAPRRGRSRGSGPGLLIGPRLLRRPTCDLARHDPQGDPD